MSSPVLGIYLLIASTTRSAVAGIMAANISKHLKQLADTGLVARRKVGLNVLYELDDPVVEKICHLVCETILNELEDQVEQNRELLKRNKRR